MDELLRIKYTKHRLDNGMEVILYKDNSLPVVAVNLWYRVGSANERKGKTGFAHLFEHMMFQGSKHVPKQMHFRYIQEAGGNLNGSTSLDRTNYYQSVPSNDLEMVLWLESDRMGFLIPALGQDKLDNQIDVVKNERRQRYENPPYGLAWEKLFSNLYPENHPYHWPTIGWMEDIANISLQDVKDFFNLYYTPNNASLVIAGDIDEKRALELAEKYFGPIAPGAAVPPPVVPEFSLSENKYIEHPDNVHLPRLYFAWHSTAAYTKDDAALDMLSYLLSGSKNSRLYKSIVFEKELAQDISIYQHSARLDGNFIMITTPRPGVSPDKLKEEIFNAINLFIEDEITDEEFTRTRNSVKSSFIYSMQNIDNLANHLNEYNFYLNEPDSFLFDLERYRSITKEDIKQAARNYLLKPYVELRVLPKEKNGLPEAEGVESYEQ